MNTFENIMENRANAPFSIIFSTITCYTKNSSKMLSYLGWYCSWFQTHNSPLTWTHICPHVNPFWPLRAPIRVINVIHIAATLRPKHKHVIKSSKSGWAYRPGLSVFCPQAFRYSIFALWPKGPQTKYGDTGSICMVVDYMEQSHLGTHFLFWFPMTEG